MLRENVAVEELRGDTGVGASQVKPSDGLNLFCFILFVYV